MTSCGVSLWANAQWIRPIRRLMGSGCWQLLKKCISVILSTFPTIVCEKQDDEPTCGASVSHSAQWGVTMSSLKTSPFHIVSLPFFASSNEFIKFPYRYTTWSPELGLGWGVAEIWIPEISSGPSQRHTYVIFWKAWKIVNQGKNRKREKLKEERSNFHVL